MDPSLANLFVYSGQITLIVTLAAIGMRLIGQTTARARLAYWRAVVTACLLLPLLPVRRADVVTTSATIVRTEQAATTSTDSDASVAPSLAVLPWLLLAGGAARMSWLAIAMLR